MGVLVNAFYRVFPELEELDRKTECFINDFRKVYSFGRSVADYVVENKGKIVGKISQAVSSSLNNYFSGLENHIKGIFSELKSDFRSRPTSQQRAPAENIIEAKPVMKKPIVEQGPSAKKSQQTCYDGVEKIIQEFGSRLKEFSPFLDVRVNFHEPDDVVRSYLWPKKKDMSSGKKADKSYGSIDSIIEGADKNYLSSSKLVAQLYNSGKNTKDIRREMKSQGYLIKGYDDITQMVAVSISLGGRYERSNYNKRVAEKLGANHELIDDYLSGKSYHEMAGSFSKKTSGMGISYSSIKRLLKAYAAESGLDLRGIRAKNKIVKDG
ncbi:MAG: hypothetical protein V1866_06720 [archaeon]